MKTLASFYLIVDDSAWLRRLLPLGVELVQLRIKNREPEQVRQQIREARALCARYSTQLVVNDYWQLAMEEDCDFVHLGQGDLEKADLPAIRQSGIRLGISTHDHEELQRALRHEPSYVALGPVYQTTLKEMPWAAQGLERVSEWKKRIGSIPLVAIGGLSVERAAGVFAAGADSCAVVTDVIGNAAPEKRVGAWMELCNERS